MAILNQIMEPEFQPDSLLPTADPRERLLGLTQLYQNPYYLYLLALLAVEERTETELVFRGGDKDSNTHFEHIGHALGLIRIKDLHLGKIEDLKQQLNEEQQNDTSSSTKPEPGTAAGRDGDA